MTILFDKINIALIITACLNFILGLLIFFRGRQRKLNLVYSLNVVAIIGWVLAMMFYRSAGVESNLFWCVVLYISPTFIASTFLYFTYIFPSQLEDASWIKNLLIFLGNAGIVALVLIPNFIIKNVIPGEGEKVIIFGSGYIFYVLYIAFYFSYGFLRLFKKYIRMRGIERSQIIYLLSGYALAANLAFVTNLFMPWFERTELNWLGQIFTLFMVAFTAYAIIKYRLMDIRIVIRQSVVYLFSLLIVLGSGLLLWFYVIDVLVFSPIAVAAILVFIGAALFRPVQIVLQKLANRYLFYEVYSYQETLKELSEHFTTILNLDKLSKTIIERIVGIMKLDKAAILLRNDGLQKYYLQDVIGFRKNNGISLINDGSLIWQLKRNPKPTLCDEISQEIKEADSLEVEQKLVLLQRRTKRLGIDLYLPLFSRGQVKGVIILGKKISGNAYSAQDLQLLETLANQTAIAVENAQLYNQVQDLTENLQEKVDEQTKDIRQLSEMKTEFLRIVNHQLRTPVSIIKGLLSMLIEGSIKGEKQKEAINKLYVSSERLETILDDLLNAQDLIGKELTLNLEPSKITEIIEKVIKEFSTAVEQKGLNLTFNKPKEEIPTLLLDQSLIETALKKIIDNAVVYTEKGEISISVQKTDKDVQIIIADTGAGISKADLPRLFKLFQRGRNAEQIHQNGSGLGLFISKEYVEAHHGTIQIQSEEGQGTRVVIDLPIGKM